MRLIDADETRDDFAKTVYAECLDDKDNIRANRIIDTFDDLSTVEAEPVRHGEWVYGEYDIPHCSECGKYPKEISPYCPNCGAKMDGGEENAAIHNKK